MPSCVHYWLLETPHGPTIQGVCKLCGAERTYPSAGVEYVMPAWHTRKMSGNDVAQNRRNTYVVRRVKDVVKEG